MTEEQLKVKLLKLIDESAEGMRKNIDRAVHSGAIDLDKWDDNYELPKVVLCALLKEEEFQYQPAEWQKKLKKEIKNVYAMM